MQKLLLYLCLAALLVAVTVALVQCDKRADAEAESARRGQQVANALQQRDSLRAVAAYAARYATYDSLQRQGERETQATKTQYRDEILRRPAATWSLDSLRAFLGAD